MREGERRKRGEETEEERRNEGVRDGYDQFFSLTSKPQGEAEDEEEKRNGWRYGKRKRDMGNVKYRQKNKGGKKRA